MILATCRALIRAVITGAVLLGAPAALAQSNAAPAQPELRLTRAETYSNGSGAFVRWRFDVANKAAYPADMFVLSPGLPPCGSNTNASRTWVDFFDADDRRLYGFCALKSPDELSALWFATPVDQPPPSGVYVVFTDRLTRQSYRSELVDLRPEALVVQAAERRASGDAVGAFRLLEQAIFIQKRSGAVDPALYEEAVGLASSLVAD